MSPVISSRWGLPELPEQIPWEEFEHGMVESAAEVWFLDRTALMREAPRYSRAVVFGEGSELRWLRRSGGLYHLVYVSDEGRTLPAAMRQMTLTAVDAEPRQFLLWSGDDGRIPVPPEYPRGSGRSPGRKAITICHYALDHRRLFRCVKLQPWKEEP